MLIKQGNLMKHQGEVTNQFQNKSAKKGWLSTKVAAKPLTRGSSAWIDPRVGQHWAAHVGDFKARITSNQYAVAQQRFTQTLKESPFQESRHQLKKACLTWEPLLMMVFVIEAVTSHITVCSTSRESDFPSHSFSSFSFSAQDFKEQGRVKKPQTE